MKKIYLLIAILVIVLALAASYISLTPTKYLTPADLSPYVTDTPCGGAAQCPEGYSCISLPTQPGVVGGPNLFCATNEFVSNPCKYYKCPFGKQCSVHESNPSHIWCT